jgi:hypothetical protein
MKKRGCFAWRGIVVALFISRNVKKLLCTDVTAKERY